MSWGLLWSAKQHDQKKIRREARRFISETGLDQSSKR
jgi:hypothetical protein